MVIIPIPFVYKVVAIPPPLINLSNILLHFVSCNKAFEELNGGQEGKETDTRVRRRISAGTCCFLCLNSDGQNSNTYHIHNKWAAKLLRRSRVWTRFTDQIQSFSRLLQETTEKCIQKRLHQTGRVELLFSTVIPHTTRTYMFHLLLLCLFWTQTEK